MAGALILNWLKKNQIKPSLFVEPSGVQNIEPHLLEFNHLQKQPLVVFYKKGILKISQISQENTCVLESFFNKVAGPLRFFLKKHIF